MYHQFVHHAVSELYGAVDSEPADIFDLIVWTHLYHQECERLGIASEWLAPNVHQRCEELGGQWIQQMRLGLREWLDNMMKVHQRDMDFQMVDGAVHCTWPADLFAAFGDCLRSAQQASHGKMLHDTAVMCIELIQDCQAQWKQFVQPSPVPVSAEYEHCAPNLEYIIALGNSSLACMR